MKLGAVKYFVPFFFVFSPSLITHGKWWEILLHTSFAAIGIAIIASALEGYLLGLGLLKSRILRVIFLIGGILIAFPALISTGVGFVIIILSYLFYRFTGKNRKS